MHRIINLASEGAPPPTAHRQDAYQDADSILRSHARDDAAEDGGGQQRLPSRLTGHNRRRGQPGQADCPAGAADASMERRGLQRNNQMNGTFSVRCAPAALLQTCFISIHIHSTLFNPIDLVHRRDLAVLAQGRQIGQHAGENIDPHFLQPLFVFFKIKTFYIFPTLPISVPLCHSCYRKTPHTIDERNCKLIGLS